MSITYPTNFISSRCVATSLSLPILISFSGRKLIEFQISNLLSILFDTDIGTVADCASTPTKGISSQSAGRITPPAAEK